MRFSSSLRCSALLAATIAPSCFGATLVSVGPTDSYQRALHASTAYSYGWSQTGTYNNVAIHIYLQDAGPVGFGGGTVTGFLTNVVGAGTTPANEIVPAVVVPYVEGHVGALNIMSGLTLGPGNYYLTVTGTTGFANVGENIVAPIEVLAPGVTLAGYGIGIGAMTYAPAEVIPWQFTRWTFSVTGDPAGGSEVPEPATVTLSMAGLAALVFVGRRQGNRVS